MSAKYLYDNGKSIHKFQIVHFLQNNVLNRFFMKKNCKTLFLNLDNKNVNKND